MDLIIKTKEKMIEKNLEKERCLLNEKVNYETMQIAPNRDRNWRRKI